MASHYLGINRGKEGFTDSDFTYGTSSGSTDVELRIDDTIPWTRFEIRKALDAFERFIVTSNPAITGTEFPVNT